MRPMLKLDNLTATVGEEDEAKTIINGLSLDVPAGEVHAIMGPNGAGKSTLSYVLTGRDGYEVTGGSASLDGVDLLDMDPEERAAKKVKAEDMPISLTVEDWFKDFGLDPKKKNQLRFGREYSCGRISYLARI